MKGRIFFKFKFQRMYQKDKEEDDLTHIILDNVCAIGELDQIQISAIKSAAFKVISNPF
jgi:hypothetical protein